MLTPDLRVLLDGHDISSSIDEDLTFSSVDGGGFENASWSFPRRVTVRKGAPVHIGLGLETAWEGRVAEPGDTLSGAPKTSVACEGYGARLKEYPVEEIYVDRDQQGWRGPSVQRKLNLQASIGLGDPSTEPDATTGAPAVRTSISSPWGTGAAKRQAEAWYDAQGIAIGQLRYGWRRGANVDSANVNWSWVARLSSDDVATSVDATANLRAAGPGSGTLSSSASNRTFANLYLAFADLANSADGYEYPIDWDNLAIYGTHGLPQRTIAGAPPGFYPDDIARHALMASGAGIDPGMIEVASGFVVPQAVYRNVEAEQILDEMAKLAGGFHWGTWEAEGFARGRPRFDFRSLPTTMSAFCSRADCDDLQLASRLGDLYDRVLVTYDDPAGGPKTVERIRSMPELSEADVGSRTLPINMGTGTKASAEIFGDFVLALAERKARAVGTAQLSGMVRTPGGGRKHAALLRPGIDALRVTDLPDLPFIAGDRYDFQLQRVECRASRQGISTSLALGSGPDLLEVLQARLGLATEASLFGL